MDRKEVIEIDISKPEADRYPVGVVQNDYQGEPLGQISTKKEAHVILNHGLKQEHNVACSTAAAPGHLTAQSNSGKTGP